MTTTEGDEGWFWHCDWPNCGDAGGPYLTRAIAANILERHEHHAHQLDHTGPAVPTCNHCGTPTALAASIRGAVVYICVRCLTDLR